jgi:3-oxoadipate enol-lactonase
VEDAGAPLARTADGVELAGEQAGEGTPILLLHGLTATRRYVLMGSRTLERSGHRVIAYDARGHGRSSPAPAREYGYERLAADALEVLDATQTPRALLVGASMGAHTAVRVALEQPARVAGLVLVTPAFEPGSPRNERAAERFAALARGLREGGVDGFVAAYDLQDLPGPWRETVERVLRQRLAAHEHPEAVADALEVVPRSLPFGDLAQLGRLAVPALVVGSRDEADPEHPLAVAQLWSQAIPGAKLLVEEESGERPVSPIAWQGGQLSRAVAELASRVHT